MAAVSKICPSFSGSIGVRVGRGLKRCHPLLWATPFARGEKTQTEIAEILGVGTGAAISIQLRRLREVESRDRKLANRIAEVEKALK